MYNHVSDIRKNLVSDSLLNCVGFKLAFEDDKIVISNGGVFVEKGYEFDGMFKLNINDINNIFAYFSNLFSLLHNRLCH